MVNHERYCSKSYIPICPDVPQTYPVTPLSKMITWMFTLAKDCCLCEGKYGEEAPYCYNWLLHGRFVRLIRSQKMSSVSNMACC